ncbi:hypothetical protein BU15DRAFT_71272 [Melanogaster broomeanus]|nr:hypothetical protein BU15DRAFT_71272 [Melanogaster broomeanus]
MALDIERGWLVGDVTIIDATSIYPPWGCSGKLARPPAFILDGLASTPNSISSFGRMDVFYSTPRSGAEIPILSTHTSARGGDLYLVYKEAEFSGEVICIHWRPWYDIGLWALRLVWVGFYI